MSQESKNIVVTGGAGFIGSHVVEQLVKANHKVFLIDDESSGNLNNIPPEIMKHVNLYIDDISIGGRRLQSDTEFMFGNIKPEIVIHLAAQPSLLKSLEDPIRDAEVNIIGTLRLIKLAKEVGVKRFVFASTSAVKSDWGPYFYETGDYYPTSPYGISKMTAETYLQVLGGFYGGGGLSVVTLRLANVFGPRQVPLGENQLIPRALDHVLKGEPFKVFNNGKSTRDFIYVTDVVNAMILAATHRYDRGGVFNISSGKSHSVNEVLAILKKLTKFKKKWVGQEEGIHKSERWHVDMDNNLFVNEFGWQPQYTLEEGLKETVEWYKNQK